MKMGCSRGRTMQDWGKENYNMRQERKSRNRELESRRREKGNHYKKLERSTMMV
jgi:hypothetical protein